MTRGKCHSLGVIIELLELTQYYRRNGFGGHSAASDEDIGSVNQLVRKGT